MASAVPQSSDGTSAYDLLEWAIQTTDGVGLAGPDRTLEEMSELMTAEGQMMPNLDGAQEFNINTNVSIDAHHIYPVPAYNVHSETQQTPFWNGSDAFSNDIQTDARNLIYNDINVHPHASVHDLLYSDNVQRVADNLPAVQTVFNNTGRINYNIKQVLRQIKRKYLVAFKPDPITGTRHENEWIPASRAYQIPQNLVQAYNQDKMNWYQRELRRTGKGPKPSDFQAREIADWPNDRTF